MFQRVKKQQYIILFRKKRNRIIILCYIENYLIFKKNIENKNKIN